MRDTVGRVLATVVWFAILVAIALGAAGIVTGMDHPPGSAGRTDVTAAGDAEVTARLDTAKADLRDLTSRVDELGTQARTALAALNGTDTTVSEKAIAAGDELVTDIIVRAASLRQDLANVPYVASPTAGLVVTDEVVARHGALVAALDATDGLGADWARLTAGAVPATRMSGYLAEHDRFIAQAVNKGLLSKYDEAIPLIDQAALQLASARDQRNGLVRTVDVSVLDQWLDRNSAYDVALKDLYTAIDKAGGKPTAATKVAVEAEKAARARLPADPSGLVIIMADIGRTGMNGAIIDIEEARGELTDALDADDAAATDEPDDPGATTGP